METLCGNQPGPRFAELSAWIFHMPGDPGTRQNRGNPGNPAMTSNTAPNRATALLEHFQLNTVIEGTRLVGGMLKKPVIMARLPVTTVLSALAFGEKVHGSVLSGTEPRARKVVSGLPGHRQYQVHLHVRMSNKWLKTSGTDAWTKRVTYGDTRDSISQ